MEDLVIYIVIIAISGLISIANKVKENEKKKKKESVHSPQNIQPSKHIQKIACPFCGAPNEKARQFCQICGFNILSFSTEETKKQEIKKKEEIAAKADLISKREQEIQKKESSDFKKNESHYSPRNKETIKNKKALTSQINIRQIFLYKELLDKPLSMRKRQ